MARLIDGDKLLECYDGLDKYHVPVGAVKENINDMPTVDAMPVVRCKDCTNYAGDGMYCAWGLLTGDMGYCHHGYVADRAAATEETGASGERKGGDE